LRVEFKTNGGACIGKNLPDGGAPVLPKVFKPAAQATA
jgi:hypothetical protein